MRKRVIDSGYTSEGSLYEGQMEQLLGAPMDRSQYKDPDEVAEAIFHALSDEIPKHRYVAVPDQREAELTIRAALARVVLLNEEQPHAYDREQLIEMLEETLDNSRR